MVMATPGDRRLSRQARGYDAKWQKVRAAHLAKEPLCRFCMERHGRPESATEVDHILSIREAPHLRLVDSNLRSLCKPCHSQRTAREQGFAKGSTKLAGGCDEHGVPLDPRHHWRRRE